MIGVWVLNKIRFGLVFLLQRSLIQHRNYTVIPLKQSLDVELTTEEDNKVLNDHNFNHIVKILGLTSDHENLR